MAEKQQLFYVKPFDGTSFSNWEFRIKLLLEQQGVLKVISEDPPTDDEDLMKFNKEDVKARTIIIQCVADNILEMLKTKTTAKEIMASLCTTYAKKGISIQVALQRKFRSLKFSTGNMAKFFTEFDQTVCELKAAGGTITEQEVVLQLLSAMPENYQSVTTAIDIMFCQDQKLITLDFVKGKLLLEEARQNKNEQTSSSGVEAAFMGRGGRRGRGNWMQRGNGSGKGGNFPFQCHLCKQTGHKRAECPNKSNGSGSHGNFRGSSGNFRGNPRGFWGSKESGAHAANQVSGTEEEISFLTCCDEQSANFSNENLNVTFVIDSGATNHLVSTKFLPFLSDCKNVSYNINIAKEGERIVAKRQGNLLVKSNERKINIKNVWVCEKLVYNLLSVRKLEENGLQVIFKNKKVFIMKHNEIILEGNLDGKLYTITLTLCNDFANISVDNQMLQHRRWGHSSRFPAPGPCEVCLQGKQSRQPFLNMTEERKAKRILETISSDICGPITPSTFDGKKYFITFVDHFSHFCMCYLLEKKSDAIEAFKQFVSLVEAKFNTKIEKLRCDNGGEYASKTFKDFCKLKGIRTQYTVPYSPEQNGVAERFNRTILEKARCLIFDSKLDKCLWGEAVRASVYLINRTETRVLPNHVCPAEIWYGQKQNLGKVKLFGCTAYNLIPKETRTSKLDSHCDKLKMIGYSDNGYRLWKENERKIIHGRNVVFKEQESNYDEMCIDLNQEWTINEEETEKQSTTKERTNVEEATDKDESEKEEDINEKEKRKGTRQRKIPTYLQDYNLDTDFDTEAHFAALSVGHFLSDVPQSYAKAVKCGNEWKRAIEDELNVLQENRTWELVPYPKNEKVIDSKWVFREKEVDGKIERKARLVARGYQQDSLSEEVYAPVARMVTLRILLSLYIQYDWKVMQLDVKSAFLNGKLRNPVYMKQPEGLKGRNSNSVCKLLKSLYGLRESPKCWNTLFNDTLINLGFERSKKDPCLYFSNTCFMLIHVDDLIIFSNNNNDLNCIETKLSQHFKMKRLNNKNILFLGLEIN